MSTKKNARAVELHQAFFWICDECGQDNFERGITVSPESINTEDLPEMLGDAAEAVQDWIASGLSGDFIATPSHVKCQHCETEFDTTTGDC